MLDASPFFQMIELDEVNSTNSYLAGYRPPRPTDITLVTAEYQTAGRGQTGNSWESERSQNLLFSLLLHPHSLPAAQMFVLSEAIALAIRGAIISFLNVKSVRNRPSALDVTVKWPNDIYVNDCKIGGILIETPPTFRPRRRAPLRPRSHNRQLQPPLFLTSVLRNNGSGHRDSFRLPRRTLPPSGSASLSSSLVPHSFPC